MRSLATACLLAPILAVGCAHAPPVARVEAPSVEVTLDEGRASEKPMTPAQPFEILMRFKPELPAYKLARMRFMLASPGRLVFTIYAVDGVGRPGAILKRIERDYQADFTSTAKDGKWVVEDLSDVVEQHAEVFVGIYGPDPHSEPELWATSNNTGNVFQRDLDPSLPLDALRIPRTPRLRIELTPAMPALAATR